MTLPAPRSFRCSLEDGVARLTLDRPNTRNALGPAEWHALGRHLSFLAADNTVRVVVLTGAGEAFSSGGDPPLVRIRFFSIQRKIPPRWLAFS